MSAICAHCGRVYDGRSFDALDLVDRLRHEHLRDLLVQWPWAEGTELEVRRCACGERLARVAAFAQAASKHAS